MHSTVTPILSLVFIAWATALAKHISPREYYSKFLDPWTVVGASGDDTQFSDLDISNNRREGALYGNISVGEPPKVFKVLFDTGASFSWLISSSCIQHGCENRTKYDRTASSMYDNVPYFKNQSWKLVYGGRAQASGNLASDVFDVSGLQEHQTFGVANYMTKQLVEQVADGVLGLAFHPSKWPVKGVGSFLQNALGAERFTKPVFSIFSVGDHGEVLFGGVDHSKFIGGLTYLNVTEPDSWKIHIDNVIFNGKPLGAAHDAYVDTGSNILLAPKIVAEAINKRLHATVFSQPGTIADGLWVVNCSHQQFHLSSWLGLSLNGYVFELPIADTVMERVGVNDTRCFSGIQSSNGLYWVLGGVFIQNYYFAFDNSTETPRIGIAHLRE
ncbi:hypothetical protein BGZ68_005580 [Mortierella alpina]|nr:hypothetical protein BGZ68_005580 [Mortierella alpina]